MTIMNIIKVKTNETFNQVFGADCFIENWPKITTTGIIIGKGKDDNYYVLKVKNGAIEIANNTAFFSQEELDNHLDIIEVIA